MKTVRAVLFVLVLVSIVPAQQRWTKTFGGSEEDMGFSVLQTSDGGYIVAGRTKSFGPGDYDVYLFRTDSLGETLWTRTYGTPLDDRDPSIRATRDGGYIIAASSLVDSLGDIWIIKTNADGDSLWSKRYGGGADSKGYVAEPTADGGYIISGNTTSFGAGSFDIYLIRIDSLGDTLWTRTYGGAEYEEGWAQPTADGGYIICGETATFGSGSSDVYFIRTDSAGDTLWTRTYGDSAEDVGAELRPTFDSGYIAVAYTPGRGAGGADAWLIKLDSAGDTLWTRTFGGADDDECYSVKQTADSGYILAGQTNSFSVGEEDVWLIKTDASGDTVWTATFGGGGHDIGFFVQQTADGGYVVTGFTSSFGAGGADVYLIKTAADGSVGAAEPNGQGPALEGRVFEATPNPFVCFARIPGHDAGRFNLYDVSGKWLGACQGDRVGEKLAPGVYFVSPEAVSGRSVRIVKVK
jgi:hypothetical protein